MNKRDLGFLRDYEAEGSLAITPAISAKVKVDGNSIQLQLPFTAASEGQAFLDSPKLSLSGIEVHSEASGENIIYSVTGTNLEEFFKALRESGADFYKVNKKSNED